MSKKFLTYERQLHILEYDKQLSIPDCKYATQKLEEISYYSLISGYKKLFKHAPSNKYIHGVTFNELVSFYYFDEELRTLFLKYILHVERHIKSMFSYHFCEKYGENQSSYLDINNYNHTKRNHNALIRLTHSLQKTISLPSKYAYIEHYARIYHNVPLWVATNSLTFGQISKMYQYATTDIRTKISKNFKNVSEKQLHQFINIIVKCRNVCAHGERLFSFRINETIPDTILHQKLQISKINDHYIYGKQDLFAVVIALRYLISNDEFKKFKISLSKLINTVLEQCPHLTSEKLFNAMGFPDNWNKITQYRKI
ncbi:Abi family protein [Agathobacter sp.]